MMSYRGRYRDLRTEEEGVVTVELNNAMATQAGTGTINSRRLDRRSGRWRRMLWVGRRS